MKKRMFESYPDVITVSELCEMLGISKKLAYRILESSNYSIVVIAISQKVWYVCAVNGRKTAKSRR